MKIIILGAGISGVSLAYYLQKFKKLKKLQYWKRKSSGGLLRSFNCNGIAYDISPHIIFSKHKMLRNKTLKF